MNTIMEDIKYTNRHPFLRVVVEAAEVVCGIITFAIIVLMMWVFLVVTPDQNSAECEYLREEFSRLANAVND